MKERIIKELTESVFVNNGPPIGFFSATISRNDKGPLVTTFTDFHDDAVFTPTEAEHKKIRAALVNLADALRSVYANGRNNQT